MSDVRSDGRDDLALSEERDFLLASLRDLEREHAAGDLDERNYRALRDDYTARAASVLRALGSPDEPRPGALRFAGGPEDGTDANGAAGPAGAVASPVPSNGRAPHGAAEDAKGPVGARAAHGGLAPDATVAAPARSARTPEADQAPAARGRAPEDGSSLAAEAQAAAGAVGDLHRAPARRRRAPWKAVAVAAGVLAVAGAAGVAVAASSGERLAGETLTGTVPQGTAGKLAQARQLYGQGQTLEAVKLYDEVLRDDPRQAEALTYRGWLLSLAGNAAGNQDLLARGEASIDAAIAADPAYPDAHVFKGLVRLNMRADPAGAVPHLRAFLAEDPPPEMKPIVEGALRRALEESGQATSGP